MQLGLATSPGGWVMGSWDHGIMDHGMHTHSSHITFAHRWLHRYVMGLHQVLGNSIIVEELMFDAK